LRTVKQKNFSVTVGHTFTNSNQPRKKKEGKEKKKESEGDDVLQTKTTHEFLLKTLFSDSDINSLTQATSIRIVEDR
jgi:hypothetical protein